MFDPSRHEDLGIILAMVFMSWSDQSLAEQEIQLIREEARNQGLDEEEMGILMEAIYQPPSLETILSYLPKRESRKAAAVAAYISALADHALTPVELDAFDRMCEAFELSASERDEVRTFGDREVNLSKVGDWRDALLLENLEIPD